MDRANAALDVNRQGDHPLRLPLLAHSGHGCANKDGFIKAGAFNELVEAISQRIRNTDGNPVFLCRLVGLHGCIVQQRTTNGKK